MQINKPNKKREEYAAKRREVRRGVVPRSRTAAESKVSEPKSSKSSTEDALIDLYDEPYKRKHEEDDLIINIDFSKPFEFLTKIARWIKKWLRVAQSKINRENYNLVKSFVIKNKKIVIPVTVIAVIGLGLINFMPSQSSGESAEVQGETSTNTIPLDVNPEFAIVYPAGKSKEELGSIAKISPPEAPATYAYIDNIEGNEIKISQQQLPERFKTNQDEEFKDFATNFSANTRVEGENFTAYLGISVDGVQSVVMIKDDLLILIKSEKAIVADTWSQYLNELTY